MQCRNCGDLVDPRRVELGYDYCLKEECQQRCLKRVLLAAVGVNKAADCYSKAEEVVRPRPATTTTVGGDPCPDDRQFEPQKAWELVVDRAFVRRCRRGASWGGRKQRPEMGGAHKDRNRDQHGADRQKEQAVEQPGDEALAA